MKQKRVVISILFLFAILSLYVISAQTTSETQDVEKGYACLKAKVAENNCTSNNNRLNAFNLLAGAYDEEIQKACKKTVLARKSSTNCWSEANQGACDIKSTAISILALNRIEENTTLPMNWLDSTKKTKTGLVWFLEIDSVNLTECDVNGRKITINENKIISTPSGDPAGLEKTYGGYWFKINDISKNYTISCNKAFTTTLMYQKPAGNVYYISSNPHTASSGDSTTEKVESFCFGLGNECDYESSLWAAMAIADQGEDVSPYLPYISAMSDELVNRKYLPASFLFILTEMPEYEEELKNLEVEQKYWGDKSTQLDLTPLALSALSGSDTEEIRSSRRYILTLQDKTTGCWQSDKTSFILYMIWPKLPATTTETGTTTPTTYSCSDMNYFCLPSMKCESADQIDGYECESFGDICCSKDAELQTCEDQQGVICQEGEECTTSTVNSQDSPYCCKESCITPEEEADPCPTSMTCKTRCSEGEETEIVAYSCSGGQKCCKPIEKKSNWNLILIILLIILIILIILAIIFRNQLKVWLFRTKNNFSSKKGPTPTNRPTPFFRPVPQRPILTRQPTQQRMLTRPGKPNEKDKEFEETMKKLRDMTK